MNPIGGQTDTGTMSWNANGILAAYSIFGGITSTSDPPPADVVSGAVVNGVVSWINTGATITTLSGTTSIASVAAEDAVPGVGWAKLGLGLATFVGAYVACGAGVIHP